MSETVRLNSIKDVVVRTRLSRSKVCEEMGSGRLQSVKVNIEPASDEVHGIHFTIEGLLRMDPAPEPVFFDTLLEPSSGEYKVKST